MNAVQLLTPDNKVNRINLVSLMLSLGYTSAIEIQKFVKDKHGIAWNLHEIEEDVKKIKIGEYKYSWLDDLLDKHYPQIYEYVIKGLNEGVGNLDDIAKDESWNKRERLQAEIAKNNLLKDLLGVLHKGVVVRQMRTLAMQAKQTARDVTKKALQTPSVVLDTRDKDAMLEIIEMDVNLNKIEESTE